MTLTISGFNPIVGQTAIMDFDSELGAFGDDVIRAALRKKLIAKFPEKSNLEITDLVNLSILYQRFKRGGSPSNAALRELNRYWGNPGGTLKDSKGAPEYASVVYTEQFLAGKRPWPGAPKVAAAPKLRVVAPIFKGVTAKVPVTTKAAVMRIVRHEKAKKEAAKREAACPCKAREMAKRPIPVMKMPPTLSANLKSVLGHLKYAAAQRLATSEHRGKMQEETFREKVLRLAGACSRAGVPREEQADVIRVLLVGR